MAFELACGLNSPSRRAHKPVTISVFFLRFRVPSFLILHMTAALRSSPVVTASTDATSTPDATAAATDTIAVTATQEAAADSSMIQRHVWHCPRLGR